MAINKEYNDIQLDVKFTQASTRANLVSEENISVSFGKISKYFADLHSQAFTGYLHPTHTAYSSGLYKITVDGLGHVTSAATVTGSDLPAHEHPYLPNTTKYALSDSVGGSAKTADKLTTSRTIAIGTGVTSTATSFDGSADITIPVTGIKEAYLTWGGKDFASSYSAFDAALEPRLGANRLEMCLADGIKIERTTDGGTTWTEVPTSSISNLMRRNLMSSVGTSIPISASSTAGMGTDAAKYMMRVTLDTSKAGVYTQLHKFILQVSTNGATGCYVKIRIRTQANYSAGNDTWKTWDKTNKAWSDNPTEANSKCPISGWSGFNVININPFITYGNQTSHYRNIQFIFGCTSNPDSTYGGLCLTTIQGYGGVGWTTPSNMARTGHLYSWNGNGDASFPASVTATNFTGKINTMTITGTTSGSYDLNTFLTKHPTITKSADTTSTVSPTHGGTFTVVDSVTREANGHVTKINTKTVTLPADSNTDTKVTQSSSTTSDFRPLLLGKNNQTNPENLETTVTDQTYVTKHVFVQPSTGNLTLYNASGDSPSLIFRRGTMIDSTLEWRIQNVGGKLNFDRDKNESTETWENIFQLDPTNNKMYFKNTEVSLSGHTHNYAGSTTVGGAATNIATTVTNGVSVGSTYYGVIFAADPNTSGGYPARKNDDFKYGHVDGTASSAGYAEIILGNNKDSTTAGNKRGVLTLYSKGTSYHSIETTETSTSVKHTLPATTGTILNSGTTSFTQTLSSGTKIGTIKINGTSTDLYCETNTNTDTKVTQTNTTTSADYRVLLSGNANDTTETTTGRKSVNLRFNPSSGGLYSFGFLWTDITGLTLDINTLTLSNGTLHSRRFIEKTDGGAANITNIPVTGHPFLLEVDLIRWASTTDYITRQRFTNAVNGTYSYVRYCTSGTWGSWTTRKYTDTDTKVTSSANHYTPATASGGDISKSASGATVEWGIDVVKGVTLNTDGKGHVTGISVTSGKIPENPVPSNNVTGSGTSGYLTKWNGTNTVTNGPQLGSSTTTFLRNDGTWATPPGTYTHPTYTRTDTTSTASPTHGGTFTAIDSVTSTNGHVTAVNVKTVTLPAQYVHPGKTQTDTTSTTSPAHGGTFTVVDSVTRDTYGHVSGINVKTVTLPSDQNTDTKVKVTSNATTKGYLIASTTSPNGTAVEGIADTGVYLDTTAGGLCATNVKASSTVCANTANSTSAGGIALYSTDPEVYGIMFRGTSNSGKHGYVQSDWATYFTMNSGATTRGWIFRRKGDGNYASISGAGHAVFNGSVTVGGNSTNTSGCRMEYNSTTQTLDFVFV